MSCSTPSSSLRPGGTHLRYSSPPLRKNPTPAELGVPWAASRILFSVASFHCISLSSSAEKSSVWILTEFCTLDWCNCCCRLLLCFFVRPSPVAGLCSSVLGSACPGLLWVLQTKNRQELQLHYILPSKADGGSFICEQFTLWCNSWSLNWTAFQSQSIYPSWDTTFQLPKPVLSPCDLLFWDEKYTSENAEIVKETPKDASLSQRSMLFYTRMFKFSDVTKYNNKTSTYSLGISTCHSVLTTRETLFSMKRKAHVFWPVWEGYLFVNQAHPWVNKCIWSPT